jgi:hypothetical protein
VVALRLCGYGGTMGKMTAAVTSVESDSDHDFPICRSHARKTLLNSSTTIIIIVSALIAICRTELSLFVPENMRR